MKTASSQLAYYYRNKEALLEKRKLEHPPKIRAENGNGTPLHILEKRKQYCEINRQVLNEKKRLNYRLNKFRPKSRKRVISIVLYDNRWYAKFNNKQAKIRYKLQIECDSLWDKFCSLESLISRDAFRTIERINQIEYLTV